MAPWVRVLFESYLTFDRHNISGLQDRVAFKRPPQASIIAQMAEKCLSDIIYLGIKTDPTYASLPAHEYFLVTHKLPISEPHNVLRYRVRLRSPCLHVYCYCYNL